MLYRLVPIGERHFRRAVAEFVEHDHSERNHQGLDNRLIMGPPPSDTTCCVRRCPRLSGLLNFRALDLARVSTKGRTDGLGRETGHYGRFNSREDSIELLARRAWRERLRLTVWSILEEPRHVSSIVILEPPVPFAREEEEEE
jgi:hypothetical protein